MNTTGSLLERLRQQLADLESTQRRRDGTATARFWSTPIPDAAEPTPGAHDPTSSDAAESGSADKTGSAGEFPERLTIHWANWSRVTGAYASGFAFAAASLHRPQLEPARMSEPDLLESVTQLGRIQHHKEVNLVRLVTQLEARGVASPGGLSRLDWLRTLDPSLTASAAKAVTTCAAGFNQPRWAQLRDAVTGETAEATTDGDDVLAGTAAAESGADRVTVGKAARRSSTSTPACSRSRTPTTCTRPSPT